MQLRPGLYVDPYRIEALLGVGGMAEVWQVRHEQLGSAHALKVLLRSSPELHRRLLREARVQAALEHENLLPVHDVLDVFGRPGLLMPLIEGPSLSRLLRGYGPSPAEALALLHALLDGLGAVHRAGLVHRDIKPGNVLLALRPGGLVPVLSDFGLVKQADAVQMTQTGQGFGTPAYAAPEQLRDAGSADARADLFSFGVLLVELLTGQRPFPGDNLAQIIDAHGQSPRVDGLTGDLRPLALALLQVDPAARPASVDAVRSALPAPAAGVLSAGRPICVAAQRAHQAPAPKAPQTFSAFSLGTAPSAVGSVNTNIPLQPGFVAREGELEQLGAWLARRQRLLTLTGIGGTGKTRLALQAGRASLDRWPGGVWFCDLTEARDQTDLFTAIGRALEVPLGARPAAQLASWITARGPTLLLLDNFEQLVAGCAGVVGQLLDEVPPLHLLVTSREPLRLHGEQRFAVEPFSDEDGAALFAQRAKAVDPSFVLSDDNRDDILALVSLLDGLPLAIELAAARSRMISPQDMISRISAGAGADASGRFRLLRSRDRDTAARQRTLQATLQWSWDLLSADEQATLAQLSVFEGGFTLAAAEAVVALDGDEWVDDLLAELLDKSLLQRAKGPTRGATRLTMLTSVQAFASSKLPASERQPAEARHGAYFAQLGLDSAQAVSPVAGLKDLALRLSEQDNTVAACHRALARGDNAVAVTCGLAAAALYTRRGPFSRGRELFKTLRALPGLAPHQEAALAIQHAWVQLANGDMAEGLEALDRADAAGIPELVPLTLLLRGNLLAQLGRMDDAAAAGQQALAIGKAHGIPDLESRAQALIGYVMLLSGQVPQARAELEAALALLQSCSADAADEAILLAWLGQACGWGGDLKAANAALRRALQIHRQHQNLFQEAYVLIISGDVISRGEDLGAAEQHLRRAIRLGEAIDSTALAGVAYGVRARVAARSGRLELAQEYLEEGSQRLRSLSTRILHLHYLYNRLEVEHLIGNTVGVGATVAGIQQVAEDLGLSGQPWFTQQIQMFLGSAPA